MRVWSADKKHPNIPSVHTLGRSAGAAACRMRGEEKLKEIEPHGAIAPPNEQNLKERLM
jgi:hypothetical protein